VLRNTSHDLLTNLSNTRRQFGFISSFELIDDFAINKEIELWNCSYLESFRTVTALLCVYSCKLQIFILLLW